MQLNNHYFSLIQLRGATEIIHTATVVMMQKTATDAESLKLVGTADGFTVRKFAGSE